MASILLKFPFILLLLSVFVMKECHNIISYYIDWFSYIGPSF